jgi:MFS family permease
MGRTHLPSNPLLCMVPFMPTFSVVAVVWLGRASLSQMDVPARQSYVMAVVDDAERSAAAGFTNTARTFGALLAPVLAGPLHAGVSVWPFVVVGGLKLAYDVALYQGFRALTPQEETVDGAS